MTKRGEELKKADSRAETPRTDTQYETMLKGSIPKIIKNLAVPSVLSMLVSAIYNMADTYFVGELGVAASGAVGIVFPIMMIIQAIAFTFGQGANSLISRYLGAQDSEMANKTASSALFTCLIANIIFSSISFAFLTPLLKLLGATDSILPYAFDYAKFILLGSPFIAGSFVMNNLLRSQGLNRKAMVGLTFGGILNIFLDPFFISVLGLGISGAAIATIISQFVSFSILAAMVERKSILRLRPRHISREPYLYKLILSIGISSFLRQGLGSLAVMVINNRAASFGDPAVAALTIIGRVASLFIAVIIGSGQAFQPVVGYNFGAGQYKRVKEAYTFTVKLTLVLTTAIALILFILAPQMIRLFQPDPAVVAIGTFALRLQSASFVTQPFLIITNMLYQSSGRARGALLLATLRQGVFFFPLVLVLPRLLRLQGVLLTQPIADVLSAATAIPFAIYFFRKLALMTEAKTRI